jgi:hypothetical protein
MRTVFLLAALGAVIFTVWWRSAAHAAADQAQQRADYQNFLNHLGGARAAEVRVAPPSETGLWVGGGAAALFLVAAAVAPAGGPRRRCPFCAERIAAEARVCRFCGRDVAAS